MPMFVTRDETPRIEARQFLRETGLDVRQWVIDLGGRTEKSDYDEDRDDQQAYFFVEVPSSKYPGGTNWKGVHEGDWVAHFQISGLFDVIQPADFERAYKPAPDLSVETLEDTVVNPWTGETAGDSLGLSDDQRARLALLLRTHLRDMPDPTPAQVFTPSARSQVADSLASLLAAPPTLREDVERVVRDLFWEKPRDEKIDLPSAILAVVRQHVEGLTFPESVPFYRIQRDAVLDLLDGAIR